MSLAAAYPFLKAMGWALVNSLWQFAICWLLYHAIVLSAKKLSSSARHLLGIVILFGGSLAFLVSLSFKYYYQEQSVNTSTTLGNWTISANKLDAMMPYWSLIYIVCVCFLLTKFFIFVRTTALIRYEHTEKMPVAWRLYIERISRELAIARKVQAFVSARIDTPQVIGYLKPVILLPAACLANLTTEQLEAVLLHELVHIKRNDYFVNLLVSAIEILFFFNPFVKQLTKSIRREREYSCDDMVIQYHFQPHPYASALLLLEKNRVLPLSYGIAASGKNEKQLLARVKRIMGVENRPPGMMQGAICLLALLLLAMIALLNPAKLAVDGFNPSSMALAGQNLDNLVASEEINKPVIVNFIPVNPRNQLAKTTVKTIILSTPAAQKPATLSESRAKKMDDDVVQEDIIETDQEPVKIHAVAAKQSIDYSMRSTAEPTLPEPDAKEVSVVEPYVPGSSFSFQLTQDTTMPKLKGTALNEQAARLSRLNAEIALSQVNWEKLQKEMKYSEKQMAKLKSTLSTQLSKLNWEQISANTQLQMNQKMLDQAQQTFEKDQAIRQYRQLEEYNQALLQKVQEDQELLKLSQERAPEQQQLSESQVKRFGKAKKIRKTIYF